MITPDSLFVLYLAAACLFLIFVAAVHHFGGHSVLPPESWLLLAGFAYGALQHRWLSALPPITLTPELVIFLLLPVLIFYSGSGLSIAALRREWLPIVSYAGVGVVLTLFLIGLPMAWIMGIPLLDGLFFGAAVAATDPSAVGAIMHRFAVPERLAVIIEGESLFNDGTSIVLFVTLGALVLTGVAFELGGVLGALVWAIGGAIPVGAFAGWATGRMVALWGEQNRFAGLTLTLTLAYGVFLLAEQMLHVSGVIAVLCAVLAFVRARRGGRALERGELFGEFWSYLNRLAGSILFFALGAATGSHDFPLSWAIPGVVLVLLLSRALVIYGGAGIMRLGGARLPLSWQHVLMLGGLRGAVSAALVLLIPASYPYRIDLLCLVFVLCFYSLIVHPPLLQWYLSRHQLALREVDEKSARRA